MPIFDFKCNECGSVIEALTTEPDMQSNCSCGGKMIRIFTVSNIRIKDKYPMWVDRVDDWQKRQEDKGKVVTLPAARDVL